jgi:hypothetical protein
MAALKLAVAPTPESEEWDAHAEYDIGVMIGQYLQTHPAPPGAHDQVLALAGSNLRAVGQRRLDRLGQPHLRAV